MPGYPFLGEAGKIQNAGLAPTIILSGNIHDLFFCENDQGGEYLPLINLLRKKWDISDRALVTYELNGPVRFAKAEDKDFFANAWVRWRTGMDSDSLAIKKMLDKTYEVKIANELEAFSGHLSGAQGNPAYALEFLRQLCACSRSASSQKHLIIIIERADMLIPDEDISRLSDTDRHRISICNNWFNDYSFMTGNDSVIMIAESSSLINREISRLPNIAEVEIPSPDYGERYAFIEWFDRKLPEDSRLDLWASRKKLAELTAGLTIHALRQLLVSASYEKKRLDPQDVIKKVESFIKSQLGEDLIEFKKPQHSLSDVIANRRLKEFIKQDLIPRMKQGKEEALAGIAVCGPIGSGKTFIWEAFAVELDMVVIVLKNIRSQWFGQTDVLFERLRRVLSALHKVAIIVDEADTQFGKLSLESHSTERRLTGKLQSMMSDPTLKGKIFWLLMTARIHLLSPDIRRPGRIDLIIPVLDPVGEDKSDFLTWAIKPVIAHQLDQAVQVLSVDTEGYSAASFSLLKSELAVKAKGGKLTVEEIRAVIRDMLVPDIKEAREYQALQALMNCTRRSLLPDPEVTEETRSGWAKKIKQFEAAGIS
jgi:SpoVK/Ycf46/Vps4 family AAA+-type ATPase